MTDFKHFIDNALGKPERRFPTLAISRGIGIGHVVFLHGQRRQFFRIDLLVGQIESELIRFNAAVAECTTQLKTLAVPHDPEANQPVSGIFGVHLLIIEGSSFIEKVKSVIHDQKVNSEWALKIVSDYYLDRQKSVSDLHAREKHLDIEDVSQRLLTSLLGSPSIAPLEYSGAIVVTHELRPSAIMELIKTKPAAVITERGGWTSHSAILAREFNLPMASGLRNIDQILTHGDHVIVDGVKGEVILAPHSETVMHFINVQKNIVSLPSSDLIDKTSTKTSDGFEISIRSNIDIPDWYHLATQFGAEGIGLFRSESLVTQFGALPSEETQVNAYRQIGEVAGEAGVNIRTFDIGVDQLNNDTDAPERNPSLGLRAIRLFLSDSKHFRTQIRAILRASADLRLNILLPMISGVNEISIAKEIIGEERRSLIADDIPVGDPKLGSMIEVPSAVFMAKQIASNVDFLCLGTNDLVQYLLAVDRDNDAVADWYQTLHPAVIRALDEVFSAGREADIPVVVCGEMAGSPFYVPVLIGLGALELSMNLNSIQDIRRLISGIKQSDAKAMVNGIRKCETTAETEKMLNDYYVRNWKHLFPIGILTTDSE